MDFESKLLLFKKKALWKQLEGYKSIISQKDFELNKCQQEKREAERTSKLINIILSKLNNSLSYDRNNVSELHNSLIPLKEFIFNNSSDSEFNDNFLCILNVISCVILGNQDQLNIKSIEPVSEIQKELVISELEAKNNCHMEKIIMLENKIFSLEKNISFLKNFSVDGKSENNSPSKKAKIDLESSDVPISSDSESLELKAKLKVATAELDELKKISKSHLEELETLHIQNMKITEELDLKNDQLRKIPHELFKDGMSFRQLSDDLRRIKGDFNDATSIIKKLEKEIDESNYRNNKTISQLERDVKEKYTKLDEFVRTTDIEIARLRKDRDAMRQMYEQTNSLLSSCQKQLSSYQKNINCSERTINQLTETIKKLKSHISLIPALSNGSADLCQAIESLRSDEQLYIEELENIGKAFEQLQNENTNLVKRLADKDDQISKLTGDKLKAEFAVSQNLKEAESSLERAQKIEEIAKHRTHEIESREETLRRQVASMDKNLSEQILALNSYKNRLSDASAENSYLRSKLEKQVLEISELKEMIPSPGYREQLAFEKRRLNEELSVVSKKLDAYASSGVGLVKELEEELGNYKKLMKCNSCHIRDKNAVILKCMHCFCKTCLDIRLETRQRKCPNCGDAFGASDVKQIFL